MLIKSNKLFLKGYKIYRADNIERRKGVAILISNELKSMNQIIEKDENNGRYIQIKISADDETKESIILNNIYVEPDQESNNQIIPESIWTKEHIAGDMNNMRTGLTKESGVYHIKNMGKKIKNTKVPNIISDHPILIYEMNIPIPLRGEFEEITTFDKNILKFNDNETKIYIEQNINYITQYKNPLKIFKLKIHQTKKSQKNK